MGLHPGPREPFDRLPIEGLRGLAVAQECVRASLHALRPLGAAQTSSLGKVLEGVCSYGVFAAPRGCLDQLRERPPEKPQLVELECMLRGRERLLVAAETVV